MNKPLISIIVPVFNSEKYISRCINSILEQTYGNFELIIINDGSKDKSLKICEE
jgi:glycosyltransferase involved in cell wall biosynthesis